MLYSAATLSTSALNTKLVEAILSGNLNELKAVLAEIAMLPELARNSALNNPYEPGKSSKKFEAYEGQTPLTMLFCKKTPKSESEKENTNNFTQDAVSLLINAGADPNQRNKQGYAPIHLAAQNADPDKGEDFRLALLCQLPAVQDVLKSNEPFLTDEKRGKTALQLCVDSKNINATRYLIKQGFCENELLIPYCQDSKEEQKNSLLTENYLFPNSGILRCYFESPVLECVRLTKRDHSKQPSDLKRNVIHDFEFPICLEIITSENKAVYKEPSHKNYQAMIDIICDPRAFYEMFPDKETRTQALEKMLYLPKEKIHNLLSLLDEKHLFAKRCEHEFERLEDIRSAKLLGHRVGLTSKYVYQEEGQERVETYSYEWFSSYPTFVEMTKNIINFNECVADQHNQYSDQEKAILGEVEETYRALDKAFDDDNYLVLANRYLAGKPVLLPSITEDHTAVFVLYKDRIYTVDKGNFFNNGICCYDIDKNNLEFLQKPHELAKFLKATSEAVRKKNSGVLELDSLKMLKPTPVYSIELQGQKQCNCSYTNPKRGCEAIMLALADDPTSPFAGMDSKRIRRMYKDFSLYERKKGIEEYINNHIHSSNINKWEPLFNYLNSKARSDHLHSVELAKFIVEKLKAPPIGLSDQQIVEGIERQPKQDTFHKAAETFRRVQSKEPGRLINQGAKNREAMEIAGITPNSSPVSSPSVKRRSLLKRSFLRSSDSIVVPPSFEKSIEKEISTVSSLTQTLGEQMDAKQNTVKNIEIAVAELNQQVCLLQKLLDSGNIIVAEQYPKAHDAIIHAIETISAANALIQKQTQVVEAPLPRIDDMSSVLADLLSDSEDRKSPRSDDEFDLRSSNPLILRTFSRKDSSDLSSSEEIESRKVQQSKSKPN